jgi:hypothetical protein
MAKIAVRIGINAVRPAQLDGICRRGELVVRQSDHSIRRLVMKAFAKFLAIVAVCVVGSVTLAHAQGSVFGVQVGQILICHFTGTITITLNGQVSQGTVTGSGTFQVTAVGNFDPTKPNSRNFVSYVPVSIQATSTFPGGGTATTALDLTAPAVTSSTASVNPGPAAFPARVIIVYWATVTLNGVSVKGQSAVTFAANPVFTAFPFQQEPFQLAAPVNFVDDGGNVVFTLNSLNSTFNN